MSVRYDSTRAQLVFADGSTAGIDGDTDTGILWTTDVSDVPLVELEDAIGAFARDAWSARTWLFGDDDDASGEPTYRSDLLLRYDDGLVALATTNFPRYVDEDYEAALPRVLAPLAERFEAELLGQPSEPLAESSWLYGVAVAFRLVDKSRPTNDLLALASLAHQLMVAVRDGPLSPQSARDLLATGYGKALEGSAEGPWLDGKAAPYQLGRGRGDPAAWELAKDVASFANASGGLIVIPARERVEHGKAMLDQVGDMPLADVNPQRYRDLIAEHVFPLLEDLDVGIAETAPGRGVFWVFVPEQPESLKPFLVRGAVVDDKVVSTHLSIPRRVGADTRYATIAEVHSLLVAGRARQLGREEVLDLVRRDRLPWGIRNLVNAAERAGIRIVVGNGAIRVDLPNQEPIVSSFEQISGKLLDLEVHNLCARLQPYGLAVRRTAAGQLVPEGEDG
jgi:hypothetical protein